MLEPEVKNQKLIFINYYQYAKTLLEQYEYDNSREDALKKAFRINQLNDTLVFNYLAQFQENEAKNLLDEQFRFQAMGKAYPEVVPDRFILARIALSF